MSQLQVEAHSSRLAVDVCILLPIQESDSVQLIQNTTPHSQRGMRDSDCVGHAVRLCCGISRLTQSCARRHGVICSEDAALCAETTDPHGPGQWPIENHYEISPQCRQKGRRLLTRPTSHGRDNRAPPQTFSATWYAECPDSEETWFKAQYHLKN